MCDVATLVSVCVFDASEYKCVYESVMSVHANLCIKYDAVVLCISVRICSLCE